MTLADGIGVEPSALERHASRVEQPSELIDAARQAAEHVTLDQDAYGRMWLTIPALLTPLQATATASLASLSEGLAATARDLRAAAAGYAGTDARRAVMLSYALRDNGPALPELPL
jgi:uncharacterized protein YukE